MNNVRYFRDRHLLTASALADAAGISTGHVCHIENGTREPSKSIMEAIAAALGQTVHEVFYSSEFQRGAGLLDEDDEKEERTVSDMQAAFNSLDELPAMLDAMDVKGFFGIGRRQTYELMNREDFPTIRLGTTLRVPKHLLIEWLSKEAAEKGASANAD